MECFAVSIADYCFWNQNYCKTCPERVVYWLALRWEGLFLGSPEKAITYHLTYPA
jgi:hypothetical protein